MDLRYEPLTAANLDEAFAFMRSANPFAEHTWGWGAGRFVDFRWGGNVLRSAADPTFFERHCTLVRRDGKTVAMVIAEVGAEDHCILTGTPDPELVGAALGWLVGRHQGQRLVLYPSDEASWLHEVAADHGFARGEIAEIGWGYDLDHVPEPFQPEGFTVGPITGEDDYPGIDRCLEGAFGGDRNRLPVLESLATNPMFRPDLSVVARSPEGRIASYCRGTVDAETGVAGIDPVATHPDYQRRGLGKAVVLRCFAEQRRLGGTMSYIGSAPEGSAGSRLYRLLNPASVTPYSEWSRGG